MIFVMENPQNAEELFKDWQETMLWSCLQGVMGEVYGNDKIHPASAAAVIGDFCFFAGKPDKELVAYKPEGCGKDFMIMIPRNEAWAALIEACYGEKAKKVTRYAIKKEPDVFSKEKLSEIVEGLSCEYDLKLMDEELFWWCKGQEWCRDWVRQYADYAAYQKYGLGAVILKDGEPVSGASSYSGYIGGIEVEIDTREDCRRRGLASVCGAKLILECLKRGWYPSWDAQNQWSAALAEKLGYHLDFEYEAYEILGNFFVGRKVNNG